MRRDQLYISTMARDAGDTARRYGIGVEIAEYCTAWNMDRELETTKEVVASEIMGVQNLTLHAPFNEVSPAAIDPLILEITEKRYAQAVELALSYGARKVIVHTGYSGDWYFKEWFADSAINFWRDFLDAHRGDYIIVFENVFETDPYTMIDIAKGVNDSRFKLCIDVGHVNAAIGYSKDLPSTRVGEDIHRCRDVYQWIEESAPYISHFHIHNNGGVMDTHNALYDGTIDMPRLLRLIEDKCDRDVTYTMEVHDGQDNVEWLMREGLLDD